jgi:hypothetical protein
MVYGDKGTRWGINLKFEGYGGRGRMSRRKRGGSLL